ncbi:multisubstrate pseudouridine synthase 7, variant 2 [Batrachochytrium dendrobatidis]|nr:multisubstrate pseudouridine synthase 7, variant 2 [Batrachochytrium dendrobatidis]
MHFRLLISAIPSTKRSNHQLFFRTLLPTNSVYTYCIQSSRMDSRVTKRLKVFDESANTVVNNDSLGSDTTALDSMHLDEHGSVGSASRDLAANNQPYIQKESDFGILEYVNPHIKAFTGILKYRSGDFLVNEVDLDGQIIRYKPGSVNEFTNSKSKSTPELEPKPELEQDPKSTPIPEPEPIPKPELEAIIAPTETVTNEQTKPETEKGFEKLVEQLAGDIETINSIKRMLESTELTHVTSKPIAEKSTRTGIHDTVRLYFGTQLSTTTKNGTIEFQKLKRGINKKRPSKPVSSKVDFNDLGGNYCHFTLYKENIDTMQAIAKISKSIRVPSKQFTFSGTKDKRAITTQRISVLNVRPSVLLGVNKLLGTSRIGDLSYHNTRLMLGSLSGNHFSIVLRNVEAQSDQVIHQSMQSFKQNGFINYYGMQRFGTRSVSTHSVGIALLAEKWEQAIDLIMCPKAEDSADVLQARLFWKQTQDAEKAVELFHARNLAERCILFSFVNSKCNTAYLSAVQAIPRNLRLMYVHAYQSYVWNHMATERIKLYGLKPVVGDLVIPNKATVEPRLNTTHVNDPDIARDTIQPIYITSEDDAANYTMQDVVLPQPGHCVVYPKHKVAQKYIEFMAVDGFDPYNMKRNIADFSLSGAYRKVISVATNVNWHILKYNDANVPLVQTDLDIVNQTPKPQSVPDGKYTSLVVEFTLGSSQYATMALREVMKSETNSGFHTRLSSEKQNIQSK